MQFCNYCVICNHNQAVYCHCLYLVPNTTRTKFALVSCTNRNSYPKEKVSELKGVSAVAAAGRKAEQNVRKAFGGQEYPPRLETLLQWKDREVTPI